ncbi:SNF2 family N-terminal domain-containing protein [Apiospora rasikravindrae]|uniref:SNF2 family N-terminal domain-containing protein n=1 Tax=Apiospora rasikravindrae TaxID=990691 RepID=A0ABR1RNW2_9PEZI
MAQPGRPPGPIWDEAEPAAPSEEDLRDELQLQEILLESLAGSVQLSHRSSTNTTTMAGSSNDEPGARRTFPAPQPNAQSNSGMPFQDESLWDGTSNNEHARKRTYSNHLDNGLPSMPESKSQRVSDDDDDISWADELFGGFGDDYDADRRSEYEQREIAFRQKQIQEAQDEALARMIAAEDGEEEEAQAHQPQPTDFSPRTNRMPGSWETDDSNFVDLTDDQPRHASSAGNNPGDLAYHAAIQRQRLESNSPFPSSQFQRHPGIIANGTASPLASRANNSGYRPGGPSLAELVQRTNNYNYASGTNERGDPLDDRIVIPPGYSAEIESESDQVKALLANISTESGTASGDQYESTPPALLEPLYKHQQIALKWMKGMEADEHKRGGILADDMGLGKTISTLALIVHGRAPASQASPGSLGTTVVVAPVSLLRQWQNEINDKLKHTHLLKVHDYHKKKLPYDELRKFDVVLTSYGKLGTELKAMDVFTKDKISKGEPVDKNILAEMFPFICAKESFLRLIVDESQMIKNKTTQMHQAVCRVPAKYRWCLSGTPMMNNVDEMGSLIHFLQIMPYNDPQEFKRKFAALYPRNRSYEDPQKVLKSLQVLLRAIMLRRTKTSTIDGAPIITLPNKTEMVDYVVFTEDEQQYYDDLLNQSRVEFSKFLRAGTVGKHYHAILVKLLRLRQACCHPYLHITDLEFTNIEMSEQDMATLAKEIHSARVDALKEEETPLECPICMEISWNPSILVPCGHYACHECLQLHTNSSEQQRNELDNGKAKLRCVICRGEFDMKRTVTYEAFKSVFMPEIGGDSQSQDADGEVADFESDSDSDSNSDDTDSAEDGDDIDDRGNLKDFIVDDDDDGEYQPSAKSKGKGKAKAKSKKRKGKKKDDDIQPHMLAKLRKEATRNVHAHKKYLKYLGNIWLPSAKITKCIEVIRGIQDSGEKTIVFSQWTLLLDLLEVPLKQDLHLRFRRYDGGMSAKQRDEAVQQFREDPNVKVMLTSLKAGNAGLNLVCASRVIILDPFWNPFIEKQAVDRTYRIGQRKPVEVHRILIKDTVEDRIMELQEEKREIVEGAMDEKAARDLGRLSNRDLAYIFGMGGRH